MIVPRPPLPFFLELEDRMGLNKSVGNMYEWVTHTWNPIKGCNFNCRYCYIKSRKNYSLDPRFSRREMKTNLGKDRFIFVGSMADMFGDWIPSELIKKVIRYCLLFDNHYLFQSKNPRRFIEFLKIFPEKTILGTTIETNRKIGHISKAPSTYERAYAMSNIRFDKEVTIEPILDFDVHDLVLMIKSINPKFVAIGADSKSHNLYEPSPQKIRELIDLIKPFTEVKIKRNLKRIYP